MNCEGRWIDSSGLSLFGALFVIARSWARPIEETGQRLFTNHLTLPHSLPIGAALKGGL